MFIMEVLARRRVWTESSWWVTSSLAPLAWPFGCDMAEGCVVLCFVAVVCSDEQEEERGGCDAVEGEVRGQNLGGASRD